MTNLINPQFELRALWGVFVEFHIYSLVLFSSLLSRALIQLLPSLVLHYHLEVIPFPGVCCLSPQAKFWLVFALGNVLVITALSLVSPRSDCVAVPVALWLQAATPLRCTCSGPHSSVGATAVCGLVSGPLPCAGLCVASCPWSPTQKGNTTL